MRAILKRFRADIAGVFWAGLSLFLFLSLFSYNPRDPSLNSLGSGVTPKNLCGYFGSFTADLLFQILGLTAWLLALSAARISIKRFRGDETSAAWMRAILSVGLVLTVSSLLALIFPEVKLYHEAIRVGGVAGYMISHGLLGLLNFAGVHVLLWALLLVFMVLYTEKSLKEIFKLPAQSLMELSKSLNGYLAALIKPTLRAASASPVPARAEKDPGESTVGSMLKKTFNLAGEKLEASTSLATEIAEDIKSALIVERADTKENAHTERASKRIQPARKVENWDLPKISLVQAPPSNRVGVDQKVITRNIRILEDKLAQFSVNGEVTAVKPGPAVTMYEFKPKSDVKISKITELADDLALALSSESVRIIAPVPGRDVVGIETSNPVREGVFLREGLEDTKFWEPSVRLPLILGKQADGASHVDDLRKMPHLLVAGSTGSGKSVFILSAITGLLFRHSPKTLRLILIDPKQVDLAAFHRIPHLLMPPIRESKKAVVSLKWAIKEMDKRYRSLSKFDARGLEGFNETVTKFSAEQIEEHRLANEEIENAARLESYYFTELPYIVIVVEEFGDLMAVDKANVEQAVVRLAQMARASGIHLILAMQSPRKDVVTGLIKTNIPGRISFKVASKMDSRIILDESGAERLLAGGDMLFLAPGVSKPQRHQGAWIPEAEVSAVAKFWSDQAEPEFDRTAMRMLEGSGGGYDLAGSDGEVGDPLDDNEFDEKYDEILAYVASQKEVSASLLQRRFHLGYPRAARMVEIFEKEGVVGPANGSKPRQVLVGKL